MAIRISDEERIRQYDEICRMRESDPKGFAFARICVAWDDLNSQYHNKGTDVEFAHKRKYLKDKIRGYIERGVFTTDEFAEWQNLPWHADVIVGGRLIQHGYNFKYEKR